MAMAMAMAMAKEEAIVLYPTAAIGHLISMVELGKFILTAKPSLSIHILIPTPPYNPGDTSPYIDSVSAAVSSITFHRLPAVTLPHSSSSHHESLTFDVLRLSKPLVAEALSTIAHTHDVRAFIMDFFIGPTITVSADLLIPSYFYFTTCASALSAFLSLPRFHRELPKSFKDLGDAPVDIPGCPPMKASDMAKPYLDRHDKAYQCFHESSTYFPRANGIIVNTFEALEPRAIKAVSAGECIPDAPTPPIHCVGPIINMSSKEGSMPESLAWLDSQPSGSVVFLCFGSLGVFSREQLEEIAVGLEKSGQRFLWVVRNPPQGKSQSVSLSVSLSAEPELRELLPEGFLERTKGRGLVVKNWAPQVTVLNHDSVGGFVTHCGWNSVLESVAAGVPMVAWPLYAEQKSNRVVLVEEIGIAVTVTESDSDGFVAASEVERAVTELMRSDSVRARALRMKSEATAAVSEGGSSRLTLTKLIETWTPRG